MGIRAIVVSSIVVSVLIFSGGCKNGSDEGPVVETTPSQDQPTELKVVEPQPEVVTEQLAVSLHLKFVPGQTASYKVTTETQKSITWEGDASRRPKEFTGGVTGSRVEMIFDQEVEQVDEQGQGLLKVTIKSLMYIGRVRGKVVQEYDSSKGQDQDGPLAKLIGQSYKIKMAPNGTVSALVDMTSARQAVKGDLPENHTALRLLADRAVTERHEVTALTSLDTEEVNLQDQWSDIKRFSFGMMGLKVYERSYTLQEIDSGDEAPMAVVQMEGIPSSAMAEQMAQPQPTNPFAGMADSTGSYEGRLDLNLDTGQVEECTEQLEAQWLVIDPTAAQSNDVTPAVLKMFATQLYKLERLD